MANRTDVSPPLFALRRCGCCDCWVATLGGFEYERRTWWRAIAAAVWSLTERPVKAKKERRRG